MDYFTLIEKIRERMTDGQTGRVMDALDILAKVEGMHSDVRNELILLLSRYRTWEKNNREGGYDSRELRTEGTKLQMDTIQFFDVLEDAELDGWEIKLKDLSEALNISYNAEYQTARPNSLGMIWKDRCNRDEQHNTFQQKFTKIGGEYFRFYCLLGEEQQSHEGLFRRLYHEYLKGERIGRSRMVRLFITKTHELQAMRSEFQYKLMTEFNLTTLAAENDPKAAMIKWFNHMQAKEQMDRLALDIRFSSSYWKPSIVDFVKWLQEDFCNEGLLTGKAPEIHIFFSFVLEDSIYASLGLELEDMADDTHAAIRNAVPNLQGPALVLKELHPVPVMEIIEWIKDSKIEMDTASAVHVFKAFFPEESPGKWKKEYDMKEVELILEKIIEAYNQGSLWDKI